MNQNKANQEAELLSEKYDQEDDVYYVSFKTGEPSRVIEQDDRLLVEVGVFTGLPTGFRILNYTKNKSVLLEVGEVVVDIVKRAMAKKEADYQKRENRINRFLEKVTA